MSDNADSCASLACTLGCLANSSGCPRTGCGWTPEPPAAPSAPPPRGPLCPRFRADPLPLRPARSCFTVVGCTPSGASSYQGYCLACPASVQSYQACESRRRTHRVEVLLSPALASGQGLSFAFGAPAPLVQVLFNPGQNGVCLNVPSVSATAAWSQACAPLLLPPHCKLSSTQPHELSVSATVPSYARACANASAARLPPLSSSSTATVLRSMGRCWAARPAWPPRWPSATASLSAARTGLPGSPAACL